MHLEILNKNQKDLINLVGLFKREFYLVGGTAIALHIGHRESIDFDLYKLKPLRKKEIYLKIQKVVKHTSKGFEDYNQLTIIINAVKFTFLQFPYFIPTDCELKGVIKIPDLLCLAAMKAFTLGRRAKWKDYVDLYFIIKFHYTIRHISEKATELFNDEFAKKLFVIQLSYFEGINYDEEVVYVIDNPPTDEEVKTFLIDVSLKELAEED